MLSGVNDDNTRKILECYLLDILTNLVFNGNADTSYGSIVFNKDGDMDVKLSPEVKKFLNKKPSIEDIDKFVKTRYD